MQSIRIRVDSDHYNITTKVFSGGEVHVDLSHLPKECNDYNIKARLQSGNDIMQLIMVADAMFNRYEDTKGSITIPYMPYARQDRYCADGQCFGANRVAKVLSAIRQEHLTTYDLHSDVAKNELVSYFCVNIISQASIFRDHKVLRDLLKTHHVVAPDKGAHFKASCVNSVGSDSQPVIVFDKERCPITGVIKGFTCPVDTVSGDCLIVDDICDGGGTFIGVAKELKARGAKSVSLYVTHGIFSKGFDIFTGIIDHIYTTDSFRRDDSLYSGYVAQGVQLTTILI